MATAISVLLEILCRFIFVLRREKARALRWTKGGGGGGGGGGELISRQRGPLVGWYL